MPFSPVSYVFILLLSFQSCIALYAFTSIFQCSYFTMILFLNSMFYVPIYYFLVFILFLPCTVLHCINLILSHTCIASFYVHLFFLYIALYTFIILFSLCYIYLYSFFPNLSIYILIPPHAGPVLGSQVYQVQLQ